MKAGEFTDEQIVKILRQSESGERTIRALCQEHNVTETTFYRWRSKFSGLDANETAKAWELQKENARLKRLLAERDLEVDILKEILGEK